MHCAGLSLSYVYLLEPPIHCEGIMDLVGKEYDVVMGRGQPEGGGQLVTLLDTTAMDAYCSRIQIHRESMPHNSGE